MMTTFVPFVPSALSNFQFQATLDGTNYICIITWNTFGQRYYINIYTLRNILILCLPVIASPNDYDISITGGYFDTPLIFRGSSQIFEIGSQYALLHDQHH